MVEKSPIKIQVKKDYLSKIANAQPIQALAEMIWNALDADASKIQIVFEENDIGYVDRIVVKDNGHGIKYEDANKLFSSLGGSWKAQKKQSDNGRFLHGQEGKGRFKAFALGNNVEWNIDFKDNEIIKSFAIKSLADEIDQFILSDVNASEAKSTGVKVTISNLNKNFKSLDVDNAIEKLTPIFALYLFNYPSVSIYVSLKKIAIDDFILKRKLFELNEVTYNDKKYKYQVEIIEWNQVVSKDLYLCNFNGFPLQSYKKNIKGLSNYSFTAYIKSDHISEISSSGSLDMIEWEPSLKTALDNAVNVIKQYFIDRQIEDSSFIIQKWKDENIYPFFNEPENKIEDAERKIFDILAININDNLPDFDKVDVKTKAFQFRMLKQSIEKSPDELQTIIKEVLSLPNDKQQELVELLQDTSLSSIISASKLVTDRIKFIAGLEEIIFNTETKKLLKERTQLHRILTKETWIFGNEFSLTVDDKSLTEVLRKHVENKNINVVIDKPVKRLDDSVGIVDLMLTRSIPRNHSDEREHLIVELKAPLVRIGSNEISQIESYAFAIADDERFRSLKSRWTFLVISNDIDSYAKMKREQQNYSDGMIYKSNSSQNIDITIYVKTWSELINECKHRMEFLRQQLNCCIDAEEGLNYLKEKYADYTHGVLEP